jgi:hypothetical protein
VFDEGHGIIQVGIERTHCFGTCLVYSAVLAADGKVQYDGQDHVERIGIHRGKIRLYEYRCLAQFIASSGFWELLSEYDFRDACVTDGPSYFVMVATRDRRKIVKTYMDTAPPILWAIGECIDHLVGRVEWEGPQ